MSSGILDALTSHQGTRLQGYQSFFPPDADDWGVGGFGNRDGFPRTIEDQGEADQWSRSLFP